ncbi:hypothetical protein [Parasphingorhabdus sp.]|uniref:hypothetical protein n=1 Tax=Parasphingorhabdus sp. TaxID=2709688 RepID=UPI003A933D77
MSDHNYISLTATKELSSRLQEYAQRTKVSLENITIAAKVDKGLPIRMRRGGCCTERQRSKLEYLFDRFPEGFEMDDVFEWKTTGAEKIAARRDEAARRRAGHVERCRIAHEQRYGQDTSDWLPVERMLA